MRTLYAIIAFSLLVIFPLHPGNTSPDNTAGNEDPSVFDDWTDERMKEYEDSIVRALFPMPDIVEIDPGPMSPGIDPPGADDGHVLAGYTHVPDSRDIDASCVVGEIPVSCGVSQTGGRTFEIPIGLYPGMNGMQPGIAISYNSQAPNSAMGPGWHISGLPSITRGQKDIYHDGNTSPVSMTAADAFYLDGMRLIKTEGTSSPYTYKSEHGHIMARQYFAGSVTKYFEVFYPDGKMAVFGSGDNTANHASYPLTELTDLHDNTVRYSYKASGGSDLYNIERITYNNSASVDFTYTARKTPATVYSAGINVSQQYTLTGVTAKAGDKTLDKYLFTYTEHGAAPLLTQISRETGKGGKYNPVRLYYGTGRSGEGWTNAKTQLTRAYVIDGTGNVRVQRGRFDYINGADGLVSLPVQPVYWQHHRNAGTFHHSEDRFDNYYTGDEDIIIHSNLASSYGGLMPVLKTEAGFVDILCADLLGQQEEFIIKVNNKVEGDLDKVTFTTYEAYTVSGLLKRHVRTFSFPTVYTDKKGDKSIQPKFYYPGDFNGDGKTEILAMSAHEPFGDTGKPSTCYIFDLEGNRIMYQGKFLKLKKVFYGNTYQDPQGAENRSDKLVAMDIDGDGKTDLVHIGEGGADVYTFDISGSTLTPREVGWHGGIKTTELQDRRLLVGDFNGDGCDDLFVTPSYDSAAYPSNHSTFLSKGDGTFDRYSVTVDTPLGSNAEFLSQDIDGDGMCDILRCSGDTLTACLSKKGYISEAGGFGYKLPVRHSVPVAADVNSGNSLPQVICLKTDEVYKLTWNTDERLETLLSGLAGSLGTVVKTYYSRTDRADIINDERVYTTARDAAFPYVNLLEPIPVVCATESYLAGQSQGREHYSYSNAVMHRQGLGFCGFRTVRKTDAQNRPTVSEYEPYRYGLPKSVAAPASEASFTYSVKTGPDKTVQFNLDKKTEKDLLRGTTATSSYTYDSYGFPLTETTAYSDGYKTTVTNSYSHSPTVGKGYILGLRNGRSTAYSKTGYPTTTDSHLVTGFSKGLPLSEELRIDGARVSNTVYAYDSNGLKTSETVTPYGSTLALKKEYAYTTDGFPASETDELGLETAYSYDPEGRVTAMTDIRGGVTTYSYDEAGRQISAKRPDGTETVSDYKWVRGNNFGIISVTRTETGHPQSEEIFDALGRSTWNSGTRFDGTRLYAYRRYDRNGNLTFESEPYITVGTTPYSRSYSYDMYDRPVKCAGPGARETTWSYNGNTVTVKENGVSTTRTYDSQSNLTELSDPSGTLTYELDAVGNPRTITAPGNVKTTFAYDGFRRRKTMSDPSKGTVTWSYDNAGNISEETDANGQTITYGYDGHNRLVKRVAPEFTSSYTYDQYGALKGVSSTNGTSTSIVYDACGRVQRHTESGASRYHYRKEYTYSSGNVGSVTYSVASGSTTYRTLGKETYSYANGHLTGILLNDSKQVYRLVKENSFGQPLEITTGGITRTYSYSGPIFESGRKAVAGGNTLLDLSTSFDAATSNLLSRGDRRHNLTETFGYDGLNRLVSYGGGTAAYDNKGNILSRSETGTFSYGLGSKPYALTGVGTESGLVPRAVQEVGYTSFSRPARISEGGCTAEFTYNSDYERVAMSLVSDTPGTSRTVRYLGGNFESVFQGTSTSATEERLYLGGGYYDAPAVYVRKNNKWTLYYILRDYLGSVMAVVDESGNAVERMGYDAWGNLRDPQTQRVYDAGEAPELMLGRGYTGHEHLPWFGLVNMNARLYDPALGRFLSPDPYVQSECGPQGFNRYSYCLNNPLCYIDEDGEFFWIAVGAAALISGVTNLAVHWREISAIGGWEGFWKGAGYFGIGALAGGLGAAAGIGTAVGFGSMFTVAATNYASATIGFALGAKAGTASGATYGFILNTSNSLLEGENLENSVFNGLNGAVSDGFIGGIMGGLSGGIMALKIERNFWTGKYTNRTLVQKAADIAEKNIGGTGNVAGTKKHKYATDLLDTYQRRYENRKLFFKESKKDINGKLFKLDILDKKNNIIYDWKFGYPNKTPIQLNNTPQMLKYRELWRCPSIIIKPRIKF